MKAGRCPWCGTLHRRFPYQCRAEVKVRHIILCGVGTVHTQSCRVPQFKVYAEKFPALWM